MVFKLNFSLLCLSCMVKGISANGIPLWRRYWIHYLLRCLFHLDSKKTTLLLDKFPLDSTTFSLSFLICWKDWAFCNGTPLLKVEFKLFRFTKLLLTCCCKEKSNCTEFRIGVLGGKSEISFTAIFLHASSSLAMISLYSRTSTAKPDAVSSRILVRYQACFR